MRTPLLFKESKFDLEHAAHLLTSLQEMYEHLWFGVRTEVMRRIGRLGSSERCEHPQKMKPLLFNTSDCQFLRETFSGNQFCQRSIARVKSGVQLPNRMKCRGYSVCNKIQANGQSFPVDSLKRTQTDHLGKHFSSTVLK